jgi:ribulose-5-phosphate 4-epimerase/fuculose-1-phosphate aldolase
MSVSSSAGLAQTPAADPAELRADLAAVLRMAARLGMHEGICNHFSIMLPGRRDRFLINPKRKHWSLIRASDLLLIDDAGRVLEGEGLPSRSGFCIHTRIHRAHPRATVVLHTHMPYATTLTALAEGRLLPVHQNALRFIDQCAYDDAFNGLALETDEGDRMARVMGDKRVLFLGNHGVIVVGPTVADAFDDLFFLERACQVQVMAMWTGRPLSIISDNVAKATAAQFADRGNGARLHLAAIKEILDHEEPDYAG